MDQTQVLTIVAASLPTMITVLIGILINNSRLGDMNTRINSMDAQWTARFSDLRAHMDARFNQVDKRFDQMERHFDEKLRRVEEVMDARLKHLEDER